MALIGGGTALAGARLAGTGGLAATRAGRALPRWLDTARIAGDVLDRLAMLSDRTLLS